jgi:leader peptidase (prepilin peptidase) / N-methyltransferase
VTLQLTLLREGKTMNAEPVVLALAAAPFVGSFLGVVIMRHADPSSVAATRSRCDSCGHTLAWSDMVPIGSWLTLRGRCRYCAARIGGFYPGIEFAAFAVAVWAAIVTTGWLLFATCLLGWTLLVLAVIDWNTFLLPDFLTLPLVAAGLVVTWLVDPSAMPVNFAAVLAGFVLLFGVRFLYYRLRDREGIGLGDAKLMAAAGAWVGLEGLASILLVASLAGIVACLLRWVRGGTVSTTDRLPFGTYLCVGIWMIWLYG